MLICLSWIKQMKAVCAISDGFLRNKSVLIAYSDSGAV